MVIKWHLPINGGLVQHAEVSKIMDMLSRCKTSTCEDPVPFHGKTQHYGSQEGSSSAWAKTSKKNIILGKRNEGQLEYGA